MATLPNKCFCPGRILKEHSVSPMFRYYHIKKQMSSTFLQISQKFILPLPPGDRNSSRYRSAGPTLPIPKGRLQEQGRTTPA